MHFNSISMRFDTSAMVKMTQKKNPKSILLKFPASVQLFHYKVYSKSTEPHTHYLRELLNTHATNLPAQVLC